MLQGWVVVLASIGYIGLLFGIAWFADRRAREGRSVIANPLIYSLSLAVYATAWTFYGSVGRAASDGVGFLPIYIGPTLMILLWWFLLRKMIRVSKLLRITSLADFVASRYGKSALLGGLVTVIVVVGILPYISLQLKAVSSSFQILLQDPGTSIPGEKAGPLPFMQVTAFYVALFMALFTIAFGTRHIDVSERHEGMVAAIAFESLVKLLAFLAVGAYVTWGLFDGFHDLFGKAAKHPDLAPMMKPFDAPGSLANWVWLTILSMLAIVFLPRQFQVAVIENVDEKHLKTAVWLFPLYMFAINLFVDDFHKFTPSDDAYGSIYFTMLGVHHAHVAAGLVLNAWLLGALAFGLTNYRLLALRIASYYWYFVAAMGVAVVLTQIYPSL